MPAPDPYGPANISQHEWENLKDGLRSMRNRQMTLLSTFSDDESLLNARASEVREALEWAASRRKNVGKGAQALVGVVIAVLGSIAGAIASMFIGKHQ
jgi:hypothetical protein